MTVPVGSHLLLPCEVKPGPFSNERLVRVPNEGHDWIGFVPISALEDPITKGSTQVKVIVVEVQGGKFRARVPGHGIESSIFEGSLSRLKLVGSVQT